MRLEINQTLTRWPVNCVASALAEWSFLYKRNFCQVGVIYAPHEDTETELPVIVDGLNRGGVRSVDGCGNRTSG